MRSRLPAIYPVLDHERVAAAGGEAALLAAATAALAGGARLLQYRAKRIGKSAAHDAARALRALTRAHAAVLIVNDDAALALAVEADGLHVGQDDLPPELARRLIGAERLLGVSAHTPEQARAAEAAGADYLGVGPIFASTTKQARPPIGCAALQAICREVSIPVYAIGGVDGANLSQVLAAGAHGAALAAAVFAAGDVAAATRALIAAASGAS